MKTHLERQRGPAAGAENSESGARTGRRRWGQTSFKSVDSWDGGDDTDAGVSISKKTSISSLKDRTLNRHGFRFPDSKTNTEVNTTSVSPGINPKCNSSGRNLWDNSCLTRGPGLELPLNKDAAFPKLSAKQRLKEKNLEEVHLWKDSFTSNTNTRTNKLGPLEGDSAIDVSSTDYKTKTCKNKISSNKLALSNEEHERLRSRSVNPQISGSSSGSTVKTNFSRGPNIQPVHGRVDWATKYGGHRWHQ
ncbi:unnamed protein product [Pleuronectes platessa]|uniref:Uncharacterized protein n=1 Tax=Pleuronectes platessa TaxID=8262 RepID=A0A9N7YQQ1_PLEPL|nr:unnamed protein product [Pleuronectes platessa]